MTKIELQPSYSTVALIEEPTGVEDPWDLPELRDTGIKWSGKSGRTDWACCVLDTVSFVLSSSFVLMPCTQVPGWGDLPAGSWKLRVQAQCENWGLFCSHSPSACASIGVIARPGTTPVRVCQLGPGSGAPDAA